MQERLHLADVRFHHREDVFHRHRLRRRDRPRRRCRSRSRAQCPRSACRALAARYASGYWVMPTTSQPCERYQRDSARVEKRGPLMTTIVPDACAVTPASIVASTTSCPQDRAVRIGERHVVHDVAVVVGVGAAARAIDELVEHDEIARGDVGTERSDRARPENRAHTEEAQRPKVGSLRDAGRRNRVTRAVTRDERDPSIADVADCDRRRSAIRTGCRR